MGPDALSRVNEPHSLEGISKAQSLDNTITHLQFGIQPRSVKERPLKTTKECGV